MQNSDQENFRVVVALWANAENSWNVMTNPNTEFTGWSKGGCWLPKKCCTMLSIKADIHPHTYVAIIPKWLYVKKINEGFVFTPEEVLLKKYPEPYEYPSKDCDEACFYHCSKGATVKPKCLSLDRNDL